MDFTRQPIIETVITAKEGCKLVVRSSKGAGQEEYFVDAVEVVSFGNSLFFRSLEKPKAFLVPVSDYEILEVREARMVLKNVGMDRTIRIGGGRDREGGTRTPKEVEKAAPASEEGGDPSRPLEKRRDRRRSLRRRRTQDDAVAGEEGNQEEFHEQLQSQSNVDPETGEHTEAPAEPRRQQRQRRTPSADMPSSIVRALLPPPPNLISDTIQLYKENEMFRGAFFSREEGASAEQAPVSLEEPDYTTFEMGEESMEKSVESEQEGSSSVDSRSEENWEHHLSSSSNTPTEGALPAETNEENPV